MSPVARLPVVIVGVAVEDVVPSYTLVVAAAVTVIAQRADRSGGVGDEGHRVVLAAVAVVDRAGRGKRLARDPRCAYRRSP